MVPANARRRLPALLALLRANGVTSYDDGAIRVAFGPRPPAQVDDESPRKGAQQAGRTGPQRAPQSAVDLAIRGIDYDPEHAEPEGDA